MEVWRSYFESLQGGGTELCKVDSGDASNVLQPTMCSGHGPQPDLSNRLDMPILQDEVDVAFSRVKKEAAPGKDGISYRMMTAAGLRDIWPALFGACWRSGLIPSEWRRSVVVPVPKNQQGGVCG